jgi:hypothetical protein
MPGIPACATEFPKMVDRYERPGVPNDPPSFLPVPRHCDLPGIVHCCLGTGARVALSCALFLFSRRRRIAVELVHTMFIGNFSSRIYGYVIRITGQLSSLFGADDKGP